MRAFFLFSSKGFSEAIRLSETGRWPEIGLPGPKRIRAGEARNIASDWAGFLGSHP